MEEEEDDIYGNPHVKSEEDPASGVVADANGDSDMKHEDVVHADDHEEDDEDEDDEDDSDIDIITERKEGPPPDPPVQSQSFKRIKIEQPRTTSTDNVPTQKNLQQAPLKAETPAPTKKVALRDGSKYPESRTSTIDLNATPTWDASGKPITEIDLDADIAGETKPWRIPGTDPTDFFNYGFDEFTWVQYGIKQSQMRETVNNQRAETKQFEMMLAGQAPPGQAPQPGMPGMPPMPGMPGMPSMPGMPDMTPDMMNAMMSTMQAQGVNDPSQMDNNMMMQMMQQMGMPSMPGMPGPPTGPGGSYGQNQQPHQQGQGQGFGGGGSGGGNYGGQSMQHQNSGQGYGQQQQSHSPYPGQQGQQSYGGGTPQPGQQGAPQGFEGYSAQQLAMMQGGGGGGGGGGGRGGRGRGRRW